MNRPPLTSKHILSKGDYAKARGKQVGMEACGLCLLLLATVSAVAVCGTILFALGCIFYLTYGAGKSGTILYFILSLLVGGLCKSVMDYSWRNGISMFDRAEEMNTGLPLTRANTAALPYPDSLVRASSEPEEEQHGLLLRAATETHERHEEQLVRAADRQGQPS